MFEASTRHARPRLTPFVGLRLGDASAQPGSRARDQEPQFGVRATTSGMAGESFYGTRLPARPQLLTRGRDAELPGAECPCYPYVPKTSQVLGNGWGRSKSFNSTTSSLVATAPRRTKPGLRFVVNTFLREPVERISYSSEMHAVFRPPEDMMKLPISWTEVFLLSLATVLWMDCIRLSNDKVILCKLENQEKKDTIFDLKMDISQLNLRLKTMRWQRVLFKSEADKHTNLLEMKGKLLVQMATLQKANRDAQKGNF
ncbi:uncharacterized protein LOC134767144 [Penaeus indicus]|uniref:uncharacterized protein LOC134767144 n=1 Tax=Penaeus indicus TaxID=29960 RepID=UPI00300D36C8